MANYHATLTSLFDDIADAIRATSPVTEEIKADIFHAYILMRNYDGTIPATPSVLNSCPWDFIRWASDEGIADLLWSVGDRKAVTLGSWGAPTSWAAEKSIAAGTYYCYILGFNHNKELEGDRRIHFEFGFSALSGGTHITFTQSDYSLFYTDKSLAYLPRMNIQKTNAGGWESCTMRTGTLNGDTRSFKLACPSDLRAAIKTVTKYTDNVGGTSGAQSNVTATTDDFFLPNTQEVRGVGTMNEFERQKTAQYSYYKNGNPQLKHRSDENSTVCHWFFRNPYVDNTTHFSGLHSNGQGAVLGADQNYGISPAFCI